MRKDWTALKARVSNRLSRHLCVAPFRLRNKGPMVSFTFDDTPGSAAAVGAPILDTHNARATFYVAGGLVDKWSGHWDGISVDEIVKLHRQGHEIACHTFSHTRTTDLDAAARRNVEILSVAEALRAAGSSSHPEATVAH